MKRRLLIIDEDKSVRQSLRKLLETEGLDVRVAQDTAGAMEHLKAQNMPSGVDLVILDAGLMTDNVPAMLQALVKVNPSAPLILITADREVRDLAVAAGVERIIEKPIDVPLFLETIRAVLEELDESRSQPDRVGDRQRGAVRPYHAFLRLLQERRSAPLRMSSSIKAALRNA